jgi:hypothetical protein
MNTKASASVIRHSGFILKVALHSPIRECQELLCIIGRTGDAVKLMTNCLMFGPLASRLPILHRKRDLVPLIERSLKTAKRGLVE